MYQIKRNSWHCKLYYRFVPHWDEPNTLCEYVNFILLYLIVFSLISIASVMMIGLVIAGLFDIFYYDIPLDASKYAVFPFAVGVLACIAIVSDLLTRAHRAYDKHKSMKRLANLVDSYIDPECDPKFLEEPNIIAKWWQGYKEKICFRVEIKD